MAAERALVISDNCYMCSQFMFIVQSKRINHIRVDYAYTEGNHEFLNNMCSDVSFIPIRMKTDYQGLIEHYDLIISLHCKQLFPAELVKSVRCINVHPGYNPYNRGWYPQVFSIVNKLPLGATIHEMDELLDHGPIIDQLLVDIYPWDTSLSVYQRVLETELILIEKNFLAIFSGSYSTRKPTSDGNVNLYSDFNQLCQIDLSEQASFGKVIDRLRALTHGEYKNAYFYTNDGQKVFIRIILDPVNLEIGANNETSR